MRLFLSSQDLGNYAEVVPKMARGKMSIAYIKNSQDDLPDEQRNFTTPERRKNFESLGFEFEELDLRDYFGKLIELKKKMASFGAVFCAGGNTFLLRRAMKESGFDEIITKMLQNDEILYGGWSAGACITAPKLNFLQGVDLPNAEVVPENYSYKDTIWDGLGLVDFYIVPHCDTDWFGDNAKAIVKYLDAENLPYFALDDGQVVVVNGDIAEVLR